MGSTVYNYLKMSDAQLMDSRIANTYIVDIGIVKSVTDNKSVTVLHSTRDVTIGGDKFPEVVSNNVEVLFPMMGGLSIEGEIKVGDIVLLIGTRNVVPTTVGITQATFPPDNFHYVQSNLKAIPVAGINTASVAISALGGVFSLSSSGVVIDSTSGKLRLKNTAGSLYTVINTLNTDLITFATTSSVATTAPQIAAAAATLLTALNSLTAQISALLEA